MADTIVTLHINQENRAYIDKLRGDMDVAEFLEKEILQRLVERAIEERLMATVPGGIDVGDDNLTPALLTSLADEAELNAVDLEEFEQILDRGIREQQAKREQARIVS